jgi:hypothetical protein
VAYQMALAEVITLLAEKHNVGPLPIYEFKAGGNAQKPIRIAGLEPYFRRGLFYYHPRSQYNFLEEYLNFSPEIASRLVDILDALSFQVQSWEQLGFLGGEERTFSSHTDIRKANAAQAARIRNHYRRGRKGPSTLEWSS